MLSREKIEEMKKDLESNMLLFRRFNNASVHGDLSDVQEDIFYEWAEKKGLVDKNGEYYDLTEKGKILANIYKASGYSFISQEDRKYEELDEDAILIGNTKLYEFDDDNQVTLYPTVHRGEKISEHSEQCIAYSVGLPAEANEQLLIDYFQNVQYDKSTYPLIEPNFINYHLSDLLDCFEGKDGLLSFVDKYGKEDKNLLDYLQVERFKDFNEYMEKLSKDIDKTIKFKEEHPNPYTSSEIAESIDTREGEIQEVINETNELARQNDKEESIEQDGQTQADE